MIFFALAHLSFHILIAETKQSMGIFVVGFLGFLSWYGALAASHLCTLPGAPQALPTLLTQLAEKPSQLQSPLLCRTHKLFLRKMCLSPDPVNDLTALEHSLEFLIPGSNVGLQNGSSSWEGMQESAVVRLKRRLPVHEPYTNREEEDWIYVLPKTLHRFSSVLCLQNVCQEKIWSLAG